MQVGGTLRHWARGNSVAWVICGVVVLASAAGCGRVRERADNAGGAGGVSGSASGRSGSSAGEASGGRSAGAGGFSGRSAASGGAGVAGYAGSGLGGADGGVGGTDDGASGAEAGVAGAADCNDLSQTANTVFRAAVKARDACVTDADCTRVHIVADCVGICGLVVSQAEVDALQSEAAADCREFDAMGCKPFLIACPPPGSPTCEAGHCIEQ
jgi:hypothetical protein